MLKDRRKQEECFTSTDITISWFYIFFNTFFDNYTLFCQLHLAKTKQMFYNLKQGCHFYTVFLCFCFGFILSRKKPPAVSAGGFFFTFFRRESGLCLLGLALGLRFYTIS